MDPLDGPTEERPPGLSRRQLFGRVGGGLAGLTLASLSLDLGRSAVAASGPISVRELLHRIGPHGCDPSHGIRVGLPDGPNDHPVISLRAVASRYAGIVTDYCQPVQIALQQTQVAGGGFTVVLAGVNFAGGGTATIQYRSASRPSDNRDFPTPVRRDGTFAQVINLGCSAPGMVAYTLRAIDMASGRSADTAGSYVCPQPPKLPSITVSQKAGVFTVIGMDFLRMHAVAIRLVDNATLISYFYQTTSDVNGGIKSTINAPGGYCNPGFQVSFSANDGRSVPTSQDITGVLWSNIVTLTCQ